MQEKFWNEMDIKFFVVKSLATVRRRGKTQMAENVAMVKISTRCNSRRFRASGGHFPSASVLLSRLFAMISLWHVRHTIDFREAHETAARRWRNPMAFPRLSGGELIVTKPQHSQRKKTLVWCGHYKTFFYILEILLNWK